MHLELRVELQSGLQDLGSRLLDVEGLKEDMEIREASRKAAAVRAEAAAAEALEKMEELLARAPQQLCPQPAGGTDADAPSSNTAGDVQQLQVQVQDVTARLARVDEDIGDALQQAAAAGQQVMQLRSELEETLSCMTQQYSPGPPSTLSSPAPSQRSTAPLLAYAATAAGASMDGSWPWRSPARGFGLQGSETSGSPCAFAGQHGTHCGSPSAQEGDAAAAGMRPAVYESPQGRWPARLGLPAKVRFPVAEEGDKCVAAAATAGDGQAASPGMGQGAAVWCSSSGMQLTGLSVARRSMEGSGGGSFGRRESVSRCSMDSLNSPSFRHGAGLVVYGGDAGRGSRVSTVGSESEATAGPGQGQEQQQAAALWGAGAEPGNGDAVAVVQVGVGPLVSTGAAAEGAAVFDNSLFADGLLLAGEGSESEALPEIPVAAADPMISPDLSSSSIGYYEEPQLRQQRGGASAQFQEAGRFTVAATALAAQGSFKEQAAPAKLGPDRVAATIIGSLMPDYSGSDDDADSSDRLSGSSSSCGEVELAIDAAAAGHSWHSRAASAGLGYSGLSTAEHDAQLPCAGPAAAQGQLPTRRQSWLDDLIEQGQTVGEDSEDAGSPSLPSGWAAADGSYGSQDVLRLRGGGVFEDDYSDQSAASSSFRGSGCLKWGHQAAGSTGNAPLSTVGGGGLRGSVHGGRAAGYVPGLASGMAGCGNLKHEADHEGRNYEDSSRVVQDWLLLPGREPAGFTGLRVWHESPGFRLEPYSSSWLLDWALVQHVKTGEWWQFENRGGWIKGGGDLTSGRDLCLVGSGIRENCPVLLPGSAIDAYGGLLVGGRRLAELEHLRLVKLHLAKGGYGQQQIGVLHEQQQQQVADLGEQQQKPVEPGLFLKPQACDVSYDDGAWSPLAAAEDLMLYAPSAEACQSDLPSDYIEAAAFGGPRPLDDVELKYRGSPRSCFHKQQQQRNAAAAAAAAAVSAATTHRCSSPDSSQANSMLAHGQLRVGHCERLDLQQSAVGAAIDSSSMLLVPPPYHDHHLYDSIGAAAAPGLIQLVPLQPADDSSDLCSHWGSAGDSGCAVPAGGSEGQQSSTAEAAGSSDSSGTPPQGVRRAAEGDAPPERQQQQRQQQPGDTAAAKPPGARVVHFCEYAEQLAYTAGGSSDDGSMESFTEEQLLEAQGVGLFSDLDMPVDPVVMSYSQIIMHKPATAGRQLQLEGTQLMQDQAVLVAATRLPGQKGSFSRGCRDVFQLAGAAGVEVESAVVAVRVWQIPEGPAMGGGWCVPEVMVENKLTGAQYRFSNTNKDGWISRSDQQGVVLRHPRLAKRNDSEPLLAEAAEVRQQLVANQQLTDGDRQRLLHRLEVLRGRLAACGVVLA
eukprot:gene3358-3633_t